MSDPKLIVNMTIKRISEPFNAGMTVEVTWEADRAVGGARVFRAEFHPSEIALLDLAIDQVYSVPFYRLRPLWSQALAMHDNKGGSET